jgi:aminoglycoside phosphotransferase (APT) family kinase protein
MTTKGPLIGAGRTAEIFAWGEDRVLKLYRPEFPQDWALREARIAEAVGRVCPFAPASDGLIEIEDGDTRRTGLLYERVSGPTILHAIVRQPWRLASLTGPFARLHAAMHGVRDPALAALPAQLDQARWDIRHGPVSEGVRERALAELERRPRGDSLCHRDFHPNQVVMAPRGLVVLDWLTAGIGNPVSDIARTSLMISAPGLPPRAPLKAVMVPFLRGVMHRLYLRDYGQVQPFDRAELEIWRALLAIGRLNEHIPGEEPYLRALIERAFGN